MGAPAPQSISAVQALGVPVPHIIWVWAQCSPAPRSIWMWAHLCLLPWLHLLLGPHHPPSFCHVLRPCHMGQLHNLVHCHLPVCPPAEAPLRGGRSGKQLTRERCWRRGYIQGGAAVWGGHFIWLPPLWAWKGAQSPCYLLQHPVLAMCPSI